jgi:hypothetical protein
VREKLVQAGFSEASINTDLCIRPSLLNRALTGQWTLPYKRPLTFRVCCHLLEESVPCRTIC